MKAFDQKLKEYEFYFTGDYHCNWGGGREKWFKGKTNLHGNEWYCITPDGDIFAYVPPPEENKPHRIDLLLHTSPKYFIHPELLFFKEREITESKGSNGVPLDE